MLKQRLNEFVCWVLGHNLEGRLRLYKDNTIMEGYWQCTRCGKEVDDD